MAIGIGGAGGKLAVKFSPNSVAVNVSNTELEKTNASQKLLAFAHTAKGQLKGSKKDPKIGRNAFNSIREQLLELVEGETVITSTGGGSGNGISSELLTIISRMDKIEEIRKTRFVFVLPYGAREPQEFVENTLEFLKGSLNAAVDSTNTGNIHLFSNRFKFEQRVSEEDYNKMIVDSLKKFEAIPKKGQTYELLEGHIDEEDFDMYKAKSYFNYFTFFDYDPDQYFGDQLNNNINPLLLQPETPIEAMFLLEVPDNYDSTIFYNILDHFASLKVAPVYSVVRNPSLEKPFVTVSMLYSSKPKELVDEFNRISEEGTRAKIEKSIEQYVKFDKLEVNFNDQAEQVAQEKGQDKDEILTVLKRLGKIK